MKGSVLSKGMLRNVEAACPNAMNFVWKSAAMMGTLICA